MSVPVILGNSFGDAEVKTISTEEQTVTLKTGTVIPILRNVQEEDPVSVQWNPVCACLPRHSSKLYLNTKAKLKPGVVSYVPVAGTLQGHGMIEGHPKVASKYGAHVVQDLAARFKVSILISPGAHPELNPIEMVWGAVKMAAKRGNVDFNLTPLKALVEAEFEKITADVWARYEDHAIGVEEYYRSVDEMSAEVEEAATQRRSLPHRLGCPFYHGRGRHSRG
eukprot:contig_8110_g1898